MICSSIDIGTNSVLLLVAEQTNGKLTVLYEDQHIPRLGQGVDESGALSDDAQQRVSDVLKRYKVFLEETYPQAASDTIVTATSAVRDASNRDEFITRIKKETGWDVWLLSGNDEAQVTYRGALSVLDIGDASNKNVVLDIGGGSTEFAFGLGSSLNQFQSLNMGSVRFTERFLKHDPPASSEVKRAREEIRRMLMDEAKRLEGYENLIGVAGTVTSMAGIDLGLVSYDASSINGHACSRAFIEEKIAEFSSLTSGQIEERYPVFLKGRGDVITGGLLILSEFMEWAGFDKVITSTGGIRHGILLENRP